MGLRIHRLALQIAGEGIGGHLKLMGDALERGLGMSRQGTDQIEIVVPDSFEHPVIARISQVPRGPPDHQQPSPVKTKTVTCSEAVTRLKGKFMSPLCANETHSKSIAINRTIL